MLLYLAWNVALTITPHNKETYDIIMMILTVIALIYNYFTNEETKAHSGEITHLRIYSW